jgi:hypothetical protein
MEDEHLNETRSTAMTVLEACVEVLKTTNRPMKAREIHREIEERGLYTFRAKDPVKVIGSAIRNNLKTGRPPLVKEVEKGTFAAASS